MEIVRKVLLQGIIGDFGQRSARSVVKLTVDDVRAIRDAFEEMERRTSILAAVILRKHYWPNGPMHPAQFKALAEFGGEPAVVHRIGEHGASCLCRECMPSGG